MTEAVTEIVNKNTERIDLVITIGNRCFYLHKRIKKAVCGHIRKGVGVNPMSANVSKKGVLNNAEKELRFIINTAPPSRKKTISLSYVRKRWGKNSRFADMATRSRFVKPSLMCSWKESSLMRLHTLYM